MNKTRVTFEVDKAKLLDACMPWNGRQRVADEKVKRLIGSSLKAALFSDGKMGAADTYILDTAGVTVIESVVL